MNDPDSSPARPDFRIGQGYDIHRTIPDRPLVLGGIRIDSSFGLDGHSDADCLTHAVCDALLGAAGLKDIGHHFPNTDPAYAGIDSQRLLRLVAGKIRDLGFSVVNVDATLIAEAPKISSHQEAMQTRLAESIGIEPLRVGLKATTNEGVGDIGRGLAIAAHAVALLHRG
ncbi:MAG: 2-C-methyl-D-erythritol 2,4-cyclodiphosphate synthase [Opitutaceae bacterium]